MRVDPADSSEDSPLLKKKLVRSLTISNEEEDESYKEQDPSSISGSPKVRLCHVHGCILS